MRAAITFFKRLLPIILLVGTQFAIANDEKFNDCSQHLVGNNSGNVFDWMFLLDHEEANTRDYALEKVNNAVVSCDSNNGELDSKRAFALYQIYNHKLSPAKARYSNKELVSIINQALSKESADIVFFRRECKRLYEYDSRLLNVSRDFNKTIVLAKDNWTVLKMACEISSFRKDPLSQYILASMSTRKEFSYNPQFDVDYTLKRVLSNSEVSNFATKDCTNKSNVRRENIGIVISGLTVEMKESYAQRSDEIAYKVCKQLSKHNLSQSVLAFFYYSGRYVKEDHSKFLFWLEEAAKHGNEWAVFRLCKNYKYGEQRTKKNKSKGDMWCGLNKEIHQRNRQAGKH